MYANVHLLIQYGSILFKLPAKKPRIKSPSLFLCRKHQPVHDLLPQEPHVRAHPQQRGQHLDHERRHNTGAIFNVARWPIG